MAKIFSIKDQRQFPLLISMGFTKAKYCGDGLDGMITSIGTGYIESLILSQSLSTNGLIFIQDHLQEIQENPEFNEISSLFTQISQGTADHLLFSTKTKENPQDFLSLIKDFTIRVFDLQDFISNPSLQSFYFALEKASSKLNIQIQIFTGDSIIHSIKLNPYIYPLTLNFITLGETDFRFLYHKDYQIIDPNNFNTSLEFVSAGQEQDSEQLNLCKLLLDEIKLERRLNENSCNVLNSCVSQIKAFHVLGYKVQEDLKHLLNY